MKKIRGSFKFSLFSLLTFCFLFSMISCGGGIDRNEAKAFIGEFFDAIEAEDYEKAETYLHPDLTDDIRKFFTEVEDAMNIDFRSGIVIERYKGFRYSYYNSEIDGSAYYLTMDTKVGEQSVTMTVGIVQNDKGYGIYNINIE